MQRSFSVKPKLRPSHLLEAPKFPRPSTLPFHRAGRRPQEEEGVRQCTLYAFQYDECIVLAREQENLKCPIHGDLPLQYLAPDTVSHSLTHTHTRTHTQSHSHTHTHTYSHTHNHTYTHNHTHTHTLTHTHSHQCMAPEFCESLTKKSL